VRPFLRELMLEEQRHYPHPQLTPEQIANDVEEPPSSDFRGENVILVARVGGRLAGLCWCVLFDPGTGLEGEVAEVYVDPAHRSQGLGGRLLRQAVDLFRERNVTFACVWTRESNPQAIRLYEEAGFRRTEQLVLTWLPLPGR
jgi:ribosomal protein S18 acetylase RimI-like enzyme